MHTGTLILRAVPVSFLALVGGCRTRLYTQAHLQLAEGDWDIVRQPTNTARVAWHIPPTNDAIKVPPAAGFQGNVVLPDSRDVAIIADLQDNGKECL